jgi:aminoglycoside/choline kinase family phosphotransferase
MPERLRALFQRTYGEAPASLTPLKADGSARQLFRLTAPGKSLIGVIGPDPKENRAFLAFSRHFRRCGMPVPEIYADDPDAGVYLEEDLGDTTLFHKLSAERQGSVLSDSTLRVYEKVVDCLPRFQIDAGATLDYSVCHPRASFDRQSMAWDLNYFKYYFLRLAGIPFDEQALEDDFERFADWLSSADRDYFLYRDFQSRNIMVRGEEPWFVDYQGGRKGALQYDVASLLFDAKADLPFEARDALLRRYLDAAQKLAPIDAKRFLDFYPGFVYVRIMQALGAYGLRGFYERKEHFLQSIPYAIRNLERQMATTELPIKLPALTAVFKHLVASPALRRFGAVASPSLTVRVQSFSYKNSIPIDDKGNGGGFVFDCRALPNPGREKRYSNSYGTDADVIEYLEKDPAVAQFLRNVYALVDQSVERYQSRNFTDLLVAFGCTGGQHRSVYCAELLAKHLRERYKVAVLVRHLNKEARGA